MEAKPLKPLEILSATHYCWENGRISLYFFYCVTLFLAFSFPSLVLKSPSHNLTLVYVSINSHLICGTILSFPPAYSHPPFSLSLSLPLALSFLEPSGILSMPFSSELLSFNPALFIPLHCQNTDKWDLAPLPILKHSLTKTFHNYPKQIPPHASLHIWPVQKFERMIIMFLPVSVHWSVRSSRPLPPLHADNVCSSRSQAQEIRQSQPPLRGRCTNTSIVPPCLSPSLLWRLPVT